MLSFFVYNLDRFQVDILLIVLLLLAFYCLFLPLHCIWRRPNEDILAAFAYKAKSVVWCSVTAPVRQAVQFVIYSDYCSDDGLMMTAAAKSLFARALSFAPSLARRHSASLVTLHSHSPQHHYPPISYTRIVSLSAVHSSTLSRVCSLTLSLSKTAVDTSAS